jgi:hypothetical protein
MNEQNQSSVEWLKKELEEYGSNSHLSLDWNTFDELIEQAKAMHKEEIIHAYDDGCQLQYDLNLPSSGQQYYKETFES